ncbi:MAG: NAD(P)/FAD-dependent oxidoreductase [Candidatus Heimdallarchaeota archaeon]|nr:NAD(P)/FAD-dependent oxidoreductase [Candidatus Heimdallarchaeota archaeon]MBY8995821.1 NAD(P)/FAD-dependent oxidoreductase [Candidatus Heimdallarchaeota archaeon]
MKKKVAVIGAGIAGLSAGSYLQKFGFDTEIFEAHSKPGGLCSWWNRTGFTIDGCIHWLPGFQSTGDMYPLWKDIIPIDESEIHFFEELYQIVGSDGEVFRAFIDIKKLEEEMLRIAPEDTKQIRKFIKLVRKFKRVVIPILKPFKLMSLKEKLDFIFMILSRGRLILKLSRMTCADYGEKFLNPLLRRFFNSSYLPFLPFISIVVNSNWMVKEGVGYPLGGSQKLIEMIVGEYEKTGGKIHYNSPVEKIIITEKQTRGLKTKDETHYFDYVISTGDYHETLQRLIGEEHLGRKQRKWFTNSDADTISGLFISIGLKGKVFKNKEHRIFFKCEEPIVLNKGNEITELEVTIYDFDSTATPEDHTLLTLFFYTDDGRYWIDLRENDKIAYNEEKKKLLEEVIDRFEKQFGEISDKIVFTDIATPATFKRYTRNWKGGIHGWYITPEIFKKVIPKTIKGLKNFYMTGQWIESYGGVTNCLKGGRHVAQLIAQDFKKRDA